MNDIVKIERHDFDNAITNIKKFTEETPSEIYLNSVASHDEHLFGLWSSSHGVTGTELNNLTEQVQDYLIKMNDMDTNFIREFENIYKALDALDKDYISAILIAMNGLKKNTDDIAKAVEAQKKIVHVLKKFKEELENLKNLENIDVMWYRVECLNKYAEDLDQENKELKAKLEEIEDKYVSAETVEATNKKAKTAYILAGISLALVIVQFIVMATKVL